MIFITKLRISTTIFLQSTMHKVASASVEETVRGVIIYLINRFILITFTNSNGCAYAKRNPYKESFYWRINVYMLSVEYIIFEKISGLIIWNNASKQCFPKYSNTFHYSIIAVPVWLSHQCVKIAIRLTVIEDNY